MRKDSELVLLVPLFPTFLLGMLPLLVLPLVGFAGLAVIGVLMIACGFAEYLRAMAEYNEHAIMRGYSARLDQARYLSSLKSGYAWPKAWAPPRSAQPASPSPVFASAFDVSLCHEA
jgi:hypothetical protein